MKKIIMLSILIGIVSLAINAMTVHAEFYANYNPVTRIVCEIYENCPYKILNKVNSRTPEYQINLNDNRSVYSPCDGTIAFESPNATLTCEANTDFKFVYEGIYGSLESSHVNTFDKVGVVDRVELKKNKYKNFTVKILYQEKQITIKKFISIVKPKTPATELRPYHVQGGYKQVFTDKVWDLYKNANFLYMLQAENGAFSADRKHPRRKGQKGTDWGYCGINDFYHPTIVNDPNFFDPDWQLQKCYDMFIGGVTFYGTYGKAKTDAMKQFIWK